VEWEGQATGAERAARRECLFAEANNNGQQSDRLMLVYLVELEGEEASVDPGAFPPAELISKARTLQHTTISDSPARSLESHLLGVSNSFEKG
jgi:hypothetical protein